MQKCFEFLMLLVFWVFWGLLSAFLMHCSLVTWGSLDRSWSVIRTDQFSQFGTMADWASGAPGFWATVQLFYVWYDIDIFKPSIVDTDTSKLNWPSHYWKNIISNYTHLILDLKQCAPIPLKWSILVPHKCACFKDRQVGYLAYFFLIDLLTAITEHNTIHLNF